MFFFVLIDLFSLNKATYVCEHASLQDMADSTNAVGWSPILPSLKSVGIGCRRKQALATSVGQQ